MDASTNLGISPLIWSRILSREFASRYAREGDRGLNIGTAVAGDAPERLAEARQRIRIPVAYPPQVGERPLAEAPLLHTRDSHSNVRPVHDNAGDAQTAIRP